MLIMAFVLSALAFILSLWYVLIAYRAYERICEVEAVLDKELATLQQALRKERQQAARRERAGG